MCERVVFASRQIGRQKCDRSRDAFTMNKCTYRRVKGVSNAKEVR